MFGETMHLEEGDEGDPVQFTSKKKANTGQSAHIDMTPMVDVVFQLLTFFLLAVKRDSQEPVDVPITTHSTAVAEVLCTFITISQPRGTTEPQIVVGDNRRGEGSTITPEQIKESVEKGVHAGRPNVIVKAERFVHWGDVLKVNRIVASVDGALLYVGVQSKE